MQPSVSPGSRGKNMNVAGAIEAVSATQESPNLLSSFLSTLNQTNTTHKKSTLSLVVRLWLTTPLYHQPGFGSTAKCSQRLSEHILLFRIFQCPGKSCLAPVSWPGSRVTAECRSGSSTWRMYHTPTLLLCYFQPLTGAWCHLSVQNDSLLYPPTSKGNYNPAEFFSSSRIRSSFRYPLFFHVIKYTPCEKWHTQSI